MKLTKLDVISIVAVLFLGQSHYHTGSGWSLALIGLVLFVWDWIAD